MELSSCSLVLRALVWGWIFSLLYGCGGGGGSSGANNTSPTMTAAPGSVTLTADTTAQQAPNATVQIQLKNVPTQGYWYRYWVDGSAVADIHDSSSSANGFNLTITPATPSFMGAGTYTDTVYVEVCVDEACATPFANAPAHIPFSYVVTGNPTGDSFYVPDSLFVETPVDGSEATATVSQRLTSLPPYDMYFGLNWRANGVVSSVQFAGTNGINFDWSVNLKSKNLLSAGVYRDSLQFRMCFDENCTKTTGDSPKYLPITYSVMAEAGTDFSIREVVGQPTSHVNDLAYEKATNRIYALYWSFSNVGTLARIDPNTGIIEAAVDFSGNPERMALSDDGQSVFIINNWLARQIIEIDLTSMSVSSVTDLVGPAESIDVYSLSVAPGSSHRLAMNIRKSGFSGLVIYEAGQQIASWALSEPYTDVDSDVWAGSDSELYHFRSYSDTLYRLELTGTSLQQTASVTDFTRDCQRYVSVCSSSRITYSDGRIYSNSGVVYDVASDHILGRMAWREDESGLFFGSGTPTIAIDGSRAFFFSTIFRIVSFDLARLRPIVEARIPDSFSSTNISRQRLVFWGTDGLAFIDNNGVVIVQGNFVSQTYNPNNDPGSSIQSAPDKTVITAVGSAAIQ